jgi:hypothetical protein
MTMQWIAGQTVGAGGVTNLEFTDIPQTFTHLQLRIFGRSTLSASLDNLSMYFNNDTGNNYATHFVSGNGSSASSGAFTSQPRFYIPSLFPAATSAQFAATVIDVLDYTNTTKNKTVRTLTGFDANGSGAVSLVSGLWLSTAAITRFNCETSASIAQFSRIDLYGLTISSATGA